MTHVYDDRHELEISDLEELEVTPRFARVRVLAYSHRFGALVPVIVVYSRDYGDSLALDVSSGDSALDAAVIDSVECLHDAKEACLFQRDLSNELN